MVFPMLLISAIKNLAKKPVLSQLRIVKPYRCSSTQETFIPSDRWKWPALDLSPVNRVFQDPDKIKFDSDHHIPRIQEILPVHVTVADAVYNEKKSTQPHTPLKWPVRLKICIEVAKELNSVHNNGTSRFIHGDVKSSNMRLTENFVAKLNVPDMSKLNKFRGTPGYFDPAYMRTGKKTIKSDVYSFGVVMLEILCGRGAIDLNLPMEQQHLTTWAKPWLKTEVESLIRKISDESVVKEIKWDSLHKYAKLVLQCLHDDPNQRPTMSDVVEQLQINALSLQQ